MTIETGSPSNDTTVNSTGVISEELSSPLYMHPWDNSSASLVTSWILNSLSKEIAESVEYVSNSFELWKELEDRYDQINGAK